LNLTHRDSHEHPSAVHVDEMMDVAFDLDQIAYRIPAGHRLRIAISTNYWPMLWPSPETTCIMIKAGSIDLPERPLAKGDEVSFEEPEGAIAWQTKELRAPSYTRETATDAETGVTSINILNDAGEVEDLDHGLVSGGWAKENWSIHPSDPTSAKVKTEWQETGGRKGQMWQTRIVTRMHSDQTNFYWTARVEAYENGGLVFERDYKDQVPRDLV
jgi:hypothetical protein